MNVHEPAAAAGAGAAVDTVDSSLVITTFLLACVGVADQVLQAVLRVLRQVPGFWMGEAVATFCLRLMFVNRTATPSSTVLHSLVPCTKHSLDIVAYLQDHYGLLDAMCALLLRLDRPLSRFCFKAVRQLWCWLAPRVAKHMHACSTPHQKHIYRWNVESNIQT